jgi:protein phosphatase
MCSDGLYNHVTEDEMQSIVLAKPPDEACATLIDLANERGGYDNITVQIIRVGPGEGGLKRFLRRRRR